MSKLHKSSLYLTWTFAVLVVAAFMWQVFASGPVSDKQEEPSTVKPVASTPAVNPLPGQPIEKPIIALPVKADPSPQVVKKIAPEMHKFAAIKLPNGVETTVYPTDPLNPYHDFSVSTTVPIAIAAIRWDKEARNLEIDVDYTIPAAAEYRLKTNLLARFKENGYPQLAPDALSIMRLEPIAYTLCLQAGGKEYALYESKSHELPTKQTAHFHVPFATEYARLYETLNRTPQSVNLVFTAQYSYQSIMGGSAETRVTHAAYEALREEMRGPRGEKPAGDFLVFREGTADIKKRYRQLVSSKVTLYVGESDRDFVLSRLDREVEKNVARLSEPLSVKNLWELAEGSLLWKANFPGHAEVTPNTFDDLIRRARELKEEEDHTVQIAKRLVSKAQEEKLDDRDFHKTASTLAINASPRMRYALLLSIDSKYSFNRTWDELSDKERHEWRSMRSLMKNESEYMRHVRSRHESEVEGELRRHKSFAKTLQIDRVSNIGIAQINSAGGTISWVNGIVTIARPLAISLAVVKEVEQDKDRDVANELLARIRKLEENIHKLGEKKVALEATVGRLKLLSEIGAARAFAFYDNGGIISQHNIASVDDLGNNEYRFNFAKSPGHGYVVLVSVGGHSQTPYVWDNRIDSFVIKGADRKFGIFCAVFSQTPPK